MGGWLTCGPRIGMHHQSRLGKRSFLAWSTGEDCRSTRTSELTIGCQLLVYDFPR